MIATISFVLGVILALVILFATRRGIGSRSAFLGWLALAFGLVAVATLVLGLGLSPVSGNWGFPFNLLSILLATAAVVIGLSNLLRHERHWQTWVGFVAGLIPVLFWVAFALGYVFGIGE